MNNVFITFEHRIPRSVNICGITIFTNIFLLLIHNLSHNKEPKATDVEFILLLVKYTLPTGCAVRIKYTNNPKDRTYMYRQ